MDWRLAHAFQYAPFPLRIEENRHPTAALLWSSARRYLGWIILGFGVKLGMVPFHVWMPVTYRTAPIPAAAVMSGAAVKAGVIGLIRFLPLGAMGLYFAIRGRHGRLGAGQTALCRRHRSDRSLLPFLELRVDPGPLPRLR